MEVVGITIFVSGKDWWNKIQKTSTFSGKNMPNNYLGSILFFHVLPEDLFWYLLLVDKIYAIKLRCRFHTANIMLE